MYFDMPLRVKNVTDEIIKQMVENKQCQILPSSVGEMDCGEQDKVALSIQESFLDLHNRTIELRDSVVQSSERKEMLLFFSMPFCSWETNPLDFWISQKSTMPMLAKVALSCLITPGSSVSSERLASAIKCLFVTPVVV